MSAQQGIYLMFAPGTRPCREVISQFVQSTADVALTHDPAQMSHLRLVDDEFDSSTPSDQPDDLCWVELLRDGLTFDLQGLAPGRMVELPKFGQVFDIADRSAALASEVLLLAPGPHLAGGGHMLPVVRGMMALARDMVQHFDEAIGAIWPASESAIGRRYFESTISAWLEGGPFPALGLTAFSQTVDGALQSQGLSYFMDRELRIEPPLSHDKIAATRLGIRLINQIVLMGGIEGEERVAAPDGTNLVLQESENKRFIRVWAE